MVPLGHGGLFIGTTFVGEKRASERGGVGGGGGDGDGGGDEVADQMDPDGD